MRIGIHLPHIGRKAGPEAIRRAAIQAEQLGFADARSSEHIIPLTRPQLLTGLMRKRNAALHKIRITAIVP